MILYLASTSTDTLPGIIFRISHPNSTLSMSNVSLTCSSIVLKNKNNFYFIFLTPLTCYLNKFYIWSYYLKIAKIHLEKISLLKNMLNKYNRKWALWGLLQGCIYNNMIFASHVNKLPARFLAMLYGFIQ